ncbi:hypothetical protein AB838_09835 [Rhodobacteraceae bacterium (ex Bugula neritina AB1)]|nr:hypothetical protein AB838_09835 [Rhodobacteraceae bacterium (ex Bugula neritina AB1)]
MNKIRSILTGDGVGARAGRSAIWSFAEFGGSQALRLLSNLVLTRLLFPEAFGLMALVTVVTTCLMLFSDTGVRPSIIQNARGNDPAFLNTAWTVQVVRGLLLWLLTLALAQPIAALYDAPLLADILPVVGLTLVIQGFEPTAIHTANRYLAMGRFTQITLGSQIISLTFTAFLAWQLQSVWALVISNVFSSTLQTIAYHVFLPGLRNRFLLERDAFWQIFHFGKWIFLSTAAGAVLLQGDRAILGIFLPLEALGVYSIGYFLGSIPVLLSNALQQKVVFPLYRMKPPTESAANRITLFRARRLIAASLLMLVILLAFAGPTLVDLLYDSRYSAAGPIITLYSLSLVPLVTLNTINVALMGAGETRGMFFIAGTTALFQTGLLFVGIPALGISGAILSLGLAALLSYPLRLYFSLKFSVFDPVQDIGFTLLGLACAAVACAAHWDRVATLFSH